MTLVWSNLPCTTGFQTGLIYSREYTGLIIQIQCSKLLRRLHAQNVDLNQDFGLGQGALGATISATRCRARCIILEQRCHFESLLGQRLRRDHWARRGHMVSKLGAAAGESNVLSAVSAVSYTMQPSLKSCRSLSRTCKSIFLIVVHRHENHVQTSSHGQGENLSLNKRVTYIGSHTFF